ncbi:sugar ABC transporter ATP-binding protein [Labrys wisconsinensis]|uniref:Ribose transport system ATP-binding protein n=1 Tax=Labrys wisconsinensis TaxID=425677 RepID=A0ABU0J010_9HYPH|nr:sugar ABC transporter ATP-binding protein [Labrys wisconsinensis]MDQ0467598.1 ribose transport system ATP-binding protein [Labrys wisconsinensis]
MPEPILELADVTKTYPGVTALSHVTFAVMPGETLGLIGENGAGKSTLMKIMGGVVAPTSGAIRIGGTERAALTVMEATAAGIAFVHQELNLFDNLDVAANVLIGREPTLAGPLKLVDTRACRERVEPILGRLGADFGPTAVVGELSLAQRQLVEIAKALSLEARIVIMDEPTSSLTVSETARLLDVIADLKAHGVSVIFISHRLNEVEHCADRVVVLRDGRAVGELARGEIRHDAMIRLMIGRDLKSLYIPPAAPPGEPVLSIEEVRTAAYPDRGVSLEVRRGEILGFAGLVGSGRTELARAVFGIDRMLGGGLRLEGRPLAVASPRDAIDSGIYLVPEDRKRSGLLLDLSVAENISLPDLASYATATLVSRDAEAGGAERQKQRLGIKTPTVGTAVGTLSGGNQQKVVLAKWLSMKPRVMIFDEPTRGIDVGAKKEIYELMRRLADGGVAILMISSDMEEVIGVSDRMAVMHEGRISGFLDRARFSEQNVLQLAVGRPLN